MIDHDILSSLLAVVVLVNVAVITYVLSGGSWPVRPGRPAEGRRHGVEVHPRPGRDVSPGPLSTGASGPDAPSSGSILD